MALQYVEPVCVITAFRLCYASAKRVKHAPDGMAKKKKSKAKKGTTAGPSTEAPAEEELTAIEAIFPETEAHEDRHGFSLRVLPHYDEAETNHVSIVLKIRWTPSPMVASARQK